MEYSELLTRAKKNMPEVVFEKERFEVPKAKGHLEGNKTIISNFLTLVSTLRREKEHLLKFLLRELATPGELNSSGLLILKAKIPAQKINEKIKQYAHEFVLCQKCGKPDTHLHKEGEFMHIICEVCGAKQQVKAKI